MDIKLEQLDGTRFVLELPASDSRPARSLGVDRAVDLGGALRTTPGLLELAGVRAELGTIDALSWPLGSGSVTLAAPAELSSARIDLQAPLGGSRLPVVLDSTLGHIEARALRLELPGLQLATSLQGSAIDVKYRDGELTARAATARTTDFQLSGGGALIRGALSVSGLRLTQGDGAIAAQAATITASELSLRAGALELTARGLNIPGGLAVKGSTARPDIRIDHANIHELDIDLELPEPGASEGPPLHLADDVLRRGEDALFDLRDLDRLSGGLELGVAVHAQLPVVGTYSLARTFRIPVDEGSFDFVDVERQLSTLEDAFIDFAVREGALILKRDIPILPTKGKTLVKWPLSPVEQALAQNRLIRLRTLFRYEMARPQKGEGRATIKEVRVEEPHISLSLAPRSGPEPEDAAPAAIALHEIGNLSLSGGLRYRGLRSDESNIRQLAAGITARALRLALRELDIGGRRLGAAEIAAAELEVTVAEWSGFRPRKIHIRGRELEVRQLAIRGTARASTS